VSKKRRKKKLPKDALDDDKLKRYIEDNFPFVGQVYIPLGFSPAFIGFCVTERENPVLVYDTNKIIDILMKRDEMTRDDAIEYFDYNIEAFRTSEGTHPLFVHCIQQKDWKTD
jgi:hypothetical protein